MNVGQDIKEGKGPMIRSDASKRPPIHSRKRILASRVQIMQRSATWPLIRVAVLWTLLIFFLLRGAIGCATPMPASPQLVRLPDSVGELSRHDPAERRFADAMRLVEERQYTDAEFELRRLRNGQPRGSKGYEALSASLANVALLRGDMAAFVTYAGEMRDLERAQQRYPNVVDLYRARTGQPLSASTKRKVRRVYRRYFFNQGKEIKK